MWMNTRWPTVVRIRHLAPRLMRAVRTTASIHTGLIADMKQFRTAITADYLVKGHLHHPDQGHCDDHGAVSIA
jgi:hypothetical protein